MIALLAFFQPHGFQETCHLRVLSGTKSVVFNANSTGFGADGSVILQACELDHFTF